MVGSHVAQALAGYQLCMTDFVTADATLDIRDPVAVSDVFTDYVPDVVLHLAAATDVDRCEQDPEWAYAVNAVGTQNVALACQTVGALLVYISTGNVFSGEKSEPYTEFDKPDPVNVYGASKLAGEEIVSTLLNRYYIVRAGWMIGGGEKDKKFAGKIVRMILEGKTKVKAVDDKFGSPTYAHDMLRGISQLIDTGYYGLYHMANVGVATRYQIACAIRDILKHLDVEIEPVPSTHFPLPAPRINMEALDNYKLGLLGLNWMQPWRAALKAYLLDNLLPSLSSSVTHELRSEEQ